MADVTQQATPIGSLAAWRVPLAKTGEAPASAEVSELVRKDAEINALADARAAARYTNAEQTKVAGIDAGAEVNPTAAEVATALDGFIGDALWRGRLSGQALLDAMDSAVGSDIWRTAHTALRTAQEIETLMDGFYGGTAWRTGGGGGGTTPPATRSERIYYGRILAANAANLAAAITYAETLAFGTLSTSDATVAGHNIMIGPAEAGDFFVILVPANHDLLTLVNTGTQGDERNTYSRAADARNDLGTPPEQYNSYVLGPLNAGVSISYRLTLTE